MITGGLESIWFISALSLWFLTLLSAPWFVPPRDAIVTTVATLILLLTMDLTSVPGFKQELQAMSVAAIVFSLLVMSAALVALFSVTKGETNALGSAASRLTAAFGQGELLITPPVVISILAAYQPRYDLVCWLLIIWTVYVIGKPFERLQSIWKSFALETKSSLGTVVGTLARIDDPNIVRVQLASTNTWRSNRLHAVSMADGSQRYVVALFYQSRGSEMLGTGLCVGTPQEPLPINPRSVVSTHDEEKTAKFIEQHSGMAGATLVGFVVENSSIGTIRFEVATETALSQGGVMFVQIAGRTIFYQILDAETSEENFEQNPRGTHIVVASQIGSYTPAGGFEKYSWLPAMNTPVFTAPLLAIPAATFGDREFPLASVPNTDILVAAKIDELVNYHTAILGVTGTGKTELALDIVREALAKDVKVFCVDFTGQYRGRLADLNPSYPGPTVEQTAAIENLMRAVDYGAFKAEKEKKALDQAVDELRETTTAEIANFLTHEQNGLAIFELGEITSTRATLRITELYLSAIMAWAKLNKGQKQVLIVLEEAHTIIPETGGAGFDFETQWVVGRIGQIALQGRKFQVGLLVISQRTALVSKTVLSQCNTFLTHALVDQTSLNFLDSVYSNQHSRLIPNLGRFEFLAYGRGVRAARPILLRREFDQAKLDASLGVGPVS